MSRLVFVVDGFNAGGAERALLAFLRDLRQRGHRLVVFSTGAEGPLLGDFRAVAHRLASHPKRFAFDVRLPWRLARLLRAERPHACVSVLFYADVVAAAAARLAPVPLVSWQHVLPSRDLKNRRAHHRMAYRAALPRFARLVCCADCVRDDLQAVYGVPPERLVTVHNGVDLQRFAAAPPRPPDGTFRVGMLARFDAEKGQADLVRAAAALGTRLPQLRLVLAGDGPTRPAVQELAARLGLGARVEFPGHVARVEALYPSLDAVALVSLYEAHPVSLLEALACGRPVVATDLPGVREAVEDGRDALLVPPADEAALCDALVALAGDAARRAALGRAGRAHAERDFDQRRQQAELWAAIAAVSAAATPPDPHRH